MKKKIFLVGDSIRVGYCEAVRTAFENVAEVYFPDDNCRFAEYVLRHLHDWKDELKLDEVDCVHWNAGLWDTLDLFDEGVLTPIAFYEYFIDAICRRIKRLFPSAKVIFATSTLVLEHKFPNPDFAKRSNLNVERYNETAVRIVQKYGFEVNDLYTHMKDTPEEYHSDMVHFYTAAGGEHISTQVIRTIAKALEIPVESTNDNIDYQEIANKYA